MRVTTCQSLDLAGYKPTSNKKILNKSFTTTVEREIVHDRGRTGEPLCSDIMEEMCYIALVLDQKITTATAFKLIDDQLSQTTRGSENQQLDQEYEADIRKYEIRWATPFIRFSLSFIPS